MERFCLRLLFFTVLLGISIFAETVYSQESKKGEMKGPRFIELETLVVEGKIIKPEVFYILDRGEIRYSLPIEKENFIDHIIKSVEKNPF